MPRKIRKLTEVQRTVEAWLKNGNTIKNEVTTLQETVDTYKAIGADTAALERDIEKRLELIQSIFNVVTKVEDGRLKELLIKRYLMGKYWRQIGVDLNISHEHAYFGVHRKALDAVMEILRATGNNESVAKTRGYDDLAAIIESE